MGLGQNMSVAEFKAFLPMHLNFNAEAVETLIEMESDAALLSTSPPRTTTFATAPTTHDDRSIVTTLLPTVESPSEEICSDQDRFVAMLVIYVLSIAVVLMFAGLYFWRKRRSDSISSSIRFQFWNNSRRRLESTDDDDHLCIVTESKSGASLNSEVPCELQYAGSEPRFSVS